MSKVEKGLIPVRLINMTEHAHTLRGGVSVGTFCQLTGMVDAHEVQAG